MKFIQTLYFNNSKDPLKDAFGWASPEHHLMGWALSSLQLHKIYGNVELYASSNAAKLLIDDLKLPYSKAHITHDEFYLPHPKLWALSKIHTYSLQDTPFLHLDGDVFIFKKISLELLKANLIAQNLEEATDYYTSTQNELMQHFTFFPKCVAEDFNLPIPITAINAGILGGNNIPFIKEYAKCAFEYVKKNENNLSKIDPDKFNVFFEQHLFYSMASEKNTPINLLINEKVKDNQYNDLSNFHEISFKKNYLHLLGHYKRDEFTCVQMAMTLRKLYPDYYYKIISLCKSKTLSPYFTFYKNKSIESLNEQKSLTQSAALAYKKGLKTGNKRIKTNTHYTDLQNLKTFVDNFKIKKQHNFTKKELKSDFKEFNKNLNIIIESNREISLTYLYGRDLDCVNWYANIFKDDTKIKNVVLAKCEDHLIIKSKFDWGRILRSNKVEGREYYKNIELHCGEFFNLIVPEIYGIMFNLFDLDEMENIILEHLVKPISIKDLFIQMYVYVEKDIIENHLSEYEDLLNTMLKQLVLKKAIKPIKLINC